VDAIRSDDFTGRAARHRSATACRSYGHTVTPPDRPCRVAVAVLLGGLLLAGCADTAPSGSRPPGSTDTLAAPAPSAPGPAGPPAPGTVDLPWPASDAAEAAALQAEVDSGTQPWLLDPTEVAIAYAAAAHGWPDAEAYPGPDGTSVDVRNAEGDQLSLNLAQPARTGDDGIWVVTAER
jgi:hypothetical protein